MGAKQISYYFAYNSPYAFLANTRLARELAPFDVEVTYRPIYHPSSGGGPDFESPKLRYVMEDVLRFAEAYGLEPNPGPFVDTKRACLGFFVADQAGHGIGYHDALFRARWLEGRDISDDAVLTAIAEAAGLDGDTFATGLDGAAAQAALDESNAAADADGAFGVPFFVYGTSKFWGNDRIEWLVRELQKRPD